MTTTETISEAAALRAVKVTFADGNHLTTSINGTEEEIRRYYLGNYFQFGDTDEHPRDNLQRGVSVEFLD